MPVCVRHNSRNTFRGDSKNLECAGRAKPDEATQGEVVAQRRRRFCFPGTGPKPEQAFTGLWSNLYQSPLGSYSSYTLRESVLKL